MKPLLFFLILTGYSFTSKAQETFYPYDIVVTKDKKVSLLADIVEVGDTRLRFRLAESGDDSVYNVELAKVGALLYRDGKAVVIGSHARDDYWQRRNVWSSFYKRAIAKDRYLKDFRRWPENELQVGFQKNTLSQRLGFSLGPALLGTGGLFLLGAALSSAFGGESSDLLLGAGIVSSAAGVTLLVVGNEGKSKASSIRKALFLKDSGVPVRTRHPVGPRVGMLTLQLTF